VLKKWRFIIITLIICQLFGACILFKCQLEKVNGPDGLVFTNSVKFEWKGTKLFNAMTQFSYQKDNGPWNTINGTHYEWENLSEGAHIFRIKPADEEESPQNTLSWHFEYWLYNETVFVQGGSFFMGDGKNQGWMDERPQHRVTITYDYYIGKHEVTFEEYDHYCEETERSKPSDQGWGRGKRPVININWYDAQDYCNWLSEQKGYAKAYDDNGNFLNRYGEKTTEVSEVEGYRLPTEAEWEHAARGGIEKNDYTYVGSNDINDVGWFAENSNDQIQEVVLKEKNDLNLYDMSGNVFEMCQDWYAVDYYDRSPTEDPINLVEGSMPFRVQRGGCFRSESDLCRVTFRTSAFTPSVRSCLLGFRIVRTKIND